MVEERRRAIPGIGKPVVVPPALDEGGKLFRRPCGVGLRSGAGVPAVGGHPASRRVSGLDEVGDQQRASRRQPLRDRLVQVLLLRIIEVMQAQRRDDEIGRAHQVPPVERIELERTDLNAIGDAGSASGDRRPH